VKRPKHVVALKSHTFQINYTYSSWVLTYLSLLVIMSNTTVIAHLKKLMVAFLKFAKAPKKLNLNRKTENNINTY